LLLANIFLVLMAYYFVKPVREGWLSVALIEGLSKIEVKAYSAFAQSMLLVAVLPLYAWLASVLPRRTLITRVGAGFCALLVVFWLIQPGVVVLSDAVVAIAFYLFVGIFGVTLVAQFWSFASDVFGPERGKRLFPLVAIGAAAGATVGSWAGETIVSSGRFSAPDLLLLAIVPLALAIWIGRVTDQRGSIGEPSAATQARWSQPAAPHNEGGFQLIARHRYLTAMAALVLLFNWVVASGDNILFAAVQEALADDLAGAGHSPQAYATALKNATTVFYGDLYFWVNLLGLLLQAFVVSRLASLGGLSLLLLATPVISLAAYATMALAPVLSVLKVMKVAENAANYSVNNTARHMLWLPTSKTMLYQAKPTVDTLFVRIGDGLAALTVLLGTHLWRLDVIEYFLINIVIAVAWLCVAAYLSIEHRRWGARAAAA
jgi:AAA family ATP:ADP antiporter